MAQTVHRLHYGLGNVWQEFEYRKRQGMSPPPSTIKTEPRNQPASYRICNHVFSAIRKAAEAWGLPFNATHCQGQNMTLYIPNIPSQPAREQRFLYGTKMQRKPIKKTPLQKSRYCTHNTALLSRPTNIYSHEN
jgi:hypothetical protein